VGTPLASGYRGHPPRLCLTLRLAVPAPGDEFEGIVWPPPVWYTIRLDVSRGRELCRAPYVDAFRTDLSAPKCSLLLDEPTLQRQEANR
jgi:hypothetical protein